MSSSSSKESPIRIHTGGVQRAHFEKYQKEYRPEFSDDDYEDVRKEIADYYNIPAEHQHFIPDQSLAKVKRTQRAFSLVILENGQRFYADGRTAHATLLLALKAHFHLAFEVGDDSYTSVHGFIDPEGFADVPTVAEKTKELGRPITWFVRYTTSSPHSPPTPSSPLEIN